jgi:hypothetical protein
MITQEMISSDVSSEYSKPEEQAAATTAYNIGLDWVNAQPKTWCMSEDKRSRRDARREDRQKKREQSQALYDHIYSKMVPPETPATADGYQVVGFGFIALAILSGIISWIVQRILSYYWDQ